MEKGFSDLATILILAMHEATGAEKMIAEIQANRASKLSTSDVNNTPTPSVGTIDTSNLARSFSDMLLIQKVLIINQL